ncbi:aldehyde dehydrogenase family protein [Halomonas sp. HP20-15]|uniref:aldehyde dehydrogenase family protein n=1 Tax=Halomonas sp. HP20-15 TaxID=3085901 RepID=UPI002981DA3E|nr:aldehyde dehydrogenase family protein [Halomonas sp. HP20-15]MDW5377246.1 aldehyde dehydrogenase family protein [Halomonas sp. HP20-15]
MKFDYRDHNTGGNIFETRNPARPAEIVGAYAEVTNAVGVEAILSSARRAQAEWADVPPVVRGDRLTAFLDEVIANVERIAEAITLEQGKPLGEARNETLKGCAEGKFMAGEAARQQLQTSAAARPRVRNLILRRPRGTLLAICPWNFPAMTPLRKLCPAIAFGNALVIKPSQFTPAAAFILTEIAARHFPAGLVQVMPCGGAFASELTANGRFDGVSFTGSVTVGRKVAQAAAVSLIPMQLELGGKNGVIINDSQDLDSCLDQVFGAAFQTGGQRCTSISRVIVHRDLQESVVQGLAARAQALTLGDGMDPATTLGPLCNGAHFDSVKAATARAMDEGAILITGGDSASVTGCEDGYFFQPTLLDNARVSRTASQEEIFGPVLSVLPYDDFDEALSLLNETEYGLTSSLFSDSHALIQRFLDESHNGMLHVNNGTVPDVNMPFGGMKHSGLGAYSVGASASAFYTIEQSAYLAW